MSKNEKYIVIVDSSDHEKWYDKENLVYEKTRLGLQAWYLNGHYHSEKGPAVIDTTGNKYYYIYGQLHREDGPAIEYTNGAKEWFLFGQKITEEEFLSTNITDIFSFLNNCLDPKTAYQESKQMLENTKKNDVNRFKLIKYIKNLDNKWVSVLLNAMADTDYSLTRDLIDIIINYIDEENEDLVQSAALALLYGGEKSVELLMEKLIPNDKYRKVLDILFAANPDFLPLTVTP